MDILETSSTQERRVLTKKEDVAMPRPLADRVVVKVMEEERTESGILLPTQQKKTPSGQGDCRRSRAIAGQRSGRPWKSR